MIGVDRGQTPLFLFLLTFWGEMSKIKKIMERSFAIKLTVVLYKLTETFPEKEPLKFYIREKADAVLGNLLCLLYNNPLNLTSQQKSHLKETTLRDIEVLRSFFEIAKEQTWTKQEYFLVLSKEYRNIALELEKSLHQEFVKNTSLTGLKPVERPILPKKHRAQLKKRHKEILNLLGQKGALQVKDLEQFFPTLTTRTIRRDCEFLFSQNLVKRIGQSSRTQYVLS